MDTAHSPSLRSFDGSSLNGSDISISEPCSPGTPNTTDGALGLHDTTLPGTHVGAGLPSDRCVKHSRFYFPDGSLSLQVSGSLHHDETERVQMFSRFKASPTRCKARYLRYTPSTGHACSADSPGAKAFRRRLWTLYLSPRWMLFSLSCIPCTFVPLPSSDLFKIILTLTTARSPAPKVPPCLRWKTGQPSCGWPPCGLARTYAHSR